jgi:hypothetical protein
LLIVVDDVDECDDRTYNVGFDDYASPAGTGAIPGSSRDAAGTSVIVRGRGRPILLGRAHGDGRQSHRG